MEVARSRMGSCPGSAACKANALTTRLRYLLNNVEPEIFPRIRATSDSFKMFWDFCSTLFSFKEDILLEEGIERMVAFRTSICFPREAFYIFFSVQRKTV